jgi:hypothetical protein
MISHFAGHIMSFLQEVDTSQEKLIKKHYTKIKERELLAARLAGD